MAVLLFQFNYWSVIDLYVCSLATVTSYRSILPVFQPDSQLFFNVTGAANYSVPAATRDDTSISMLGPIVLHR